MSQESDLINTLSTLNHISETLNRAVDVRSVLDDALAQLVQLMGLETGWIMLKDDLQPGERYILAAHHNLPPALDAGNIDAWQEPCACQAICKERCLTQAYNQVQCSRLAQVVGDRRGLSMHASAPLRTQDQILGILNVAGPEWSAFSPAALALLTNAGHLIGIALERARLFDMLQDRRILEQTALLDFSHQLLGRMDLDDLMKYLVNQARAMLEVDACALILADGRSDALEFRATSGWWSDPVAAERRMPADNRSGPGLAMSSRQPVLTEDLQVIDPTDWMPDWLAKEGFRGHAVVPLLVETQPIGALVIDARRPRKLDEAELRFLRLMANQAALAIEKARLHERELLQQQLERELEVGRDIQMSLLPESCPSISGWDMATYYEAARVVGGDFYDFFDLPGNPLQLGLTIGDVAGKGVPAALLMALCRTIMRTTALDNSSPAAVLRRANEMIVHDNRSDLFLTALYARLEPETGRLTYASAGHNRPLWLQAASSQVQELDARGMFLGSTWSGWFQEAVVDIAPGDMIVFYTDGITEAMDGDLCPFGEGRLQAAVAAHGAGDAQQMVDAILAQVRSFTGERPLSDDMTLVVLRRLPPPGE